MKRRTHAASHESVASGGANHSRPFIDAGRAWRWGGSAILALAIWFTYRGSLDGPFIFDDVPTIAGNLSIRKLWPLVSFSGEMSPLQAPPQTSVHARPVVNLSLALNFYFSQLTPRGYRITNVALHAIVAILLAAVVRRMLRLDFFQGKFADVADPLSFATALLWALHPLDTECVAYVTQRSDVMAGLFYLLTMYAAQLYWSSATNRSRALSLLLAVVACQLGMFSKEMMASAPAMVLLYERTFIAGSFWGAIRRSWPLYLGLAIPLVTLVALNLSGPRTPAAGFGLGVSAHEWWFTQAKVLFLYLKLVIWPWPLVIHYEMPYLETFRDAWPWVIPSALLAIAVAILTLRRTTIGFAGTWFFAVLSPTLLIPLIIEIAAERRVYVPLMALVPCFVVGCYALLRYALPAATKHHAPVGVNRPLVFTMTAAVALAAVYSQVDVNRLTVYTDKFLFWNDAAMRQPDSHLVQLNLGGVCESEGQRDEAIVHYRRALELNPNMYMPHFRLADALGAVGKYDEAEPHYREAIRYNPEMASAHYGLGQVLRSRGETTEAKEQLELAVRLYPGFARAHFALASMAEESGASASAQKHYEQAIHGQPNFPAARRALGLLLMRAGKVDEAIEQFRRMPPSADACGNLAIAYSRLGRAQEALAMAQTGAAMARSQGQMADANRLATWASEYQASLKKANSPAPTTDAPNESAAPAAPR
ncbi:MAG TPA: tetratricopeptide repeat protein [Pirellulales bacterium]|jgi:tetratricopeptide (TPR) repeat protein